MPCVAVHMLLARKIAARWRRRPDEAPVDVRRPGVRRSFYHGALAPDMGFAPGADRFVSDLAHHLSTGDLTRNLLERSRDELDEGFAWGWATHVLSDAALHPLVGRAMGERLLGDRDVRMDTHENQEAHVSIEVGLDALFLARSPSLARPPSRALDGPLRLRPLAEALEDTFGLRWSETELYHLHRRTARLFPLWPLGLRVLLRGAPGLRSVGGGMGGSLIRRALSLLSARAGRGSAVAGYFRPIAPSKWLLGAVSEEVRAFPAHVRSVVRGGISALGNPNLETGGPAGAGRGHAGANRVAAELLRRRKAGLPKSRPALGVEGAGALT